MCVYVYQVQMYEKRKTSKYGMELTIGVSKQTMLVIHLLVLQLFFEYF
jgi:hypothetical protein